MTNSSHSICILGCGGFIGSHLVERILTTTNWHIYGIDRNPSKISGFLTNDRFTFANTDVEDTATVQEFIAKSDIVISLVALCNPALYNTIPLDVMKSNFLQPLSVIQQCSSQKKWLIHFSTCEVYGTTVSHNANMPFNPKTDILSEDTTPLIMGPVHAQRWSYACAKQLLERMIYAYGFEQGLSYTIIRPFNFIGPRMDFLPGIDGEGVPRVLACFMDALLDNKPLKLVDGGNNRRSFTYINDALDALMIILERPEVAKGQIFNIGNPANEASIQELADIMIKIFSSYRPERKDLPCQTEPISSLEFYGKGYEDSDRRIPDIAKAKTLLNWQPETSLLDALKSTIEFYINEYSNEYVTVCREAV